METATSSTAPGLYTTAASPIACPLRAGGAINPFDFAATDGVHYVIYKVDGNSVGHRGVRGNTNTPVIPTPLILQQLAADGVTLVWDPIQLLGRGDADGPLIEAPNLIIVNGVYFLVFSSNYYSTPQYDASYATVSLGQWTIHKDLGSVDGTNDPFAITAPGWQWLRRPMMGQVWCFMRTVMRGDVCLSGR